MHKKLVSPIIITIIIGALGIACFIYIYQSWQEKTISISNPIIEKVNKDPQSLNLKSIIHEAEKNVVQIDGQNEMNTTTGSGFLINDKGDIITNAHVVQDADVIYVRTANARVYPAAVIGIGEELDVAVIRVPQLSNQQAMTIERETFSEIGDEVIALGSPHGFQNTVTLGIISGTERNFSVDDYHYNNVYQISAQITHGNSGGPLINRNTGKVIGINSVGTEDGTIGFSIPIHTVIETIEGWINSAQPNNLDFGNPNNIVQSTDTDQLEKDAAYIVDYFFESIDIRDYINAYTLLGDTMQSEQTYSSFREQYIYITKVNSEIVENKVASQNQATLLVDVTIENKLPNKQETKKEKIRYSITVGFENDQLKILQLTKTKD
ncbi:MULTISPECIES: trypsin-like peptidase domain-containing protein [unclassified Virgibacillus]|uniref:S1C family serine protease n=1 Tax=unclassified Virgibacillus TaxID=2620237 RepID=UPI0024DE03F1|nr:trypsin-like peptidase domain-containing protein [Virgibacillus sp. LDC-1]